MKFMQIQYLKNNHMKRVNVKPILIISICMLNISILMAQIPSNGLVAYYPFNGNATDVSGNNHNGTVVNAIPDTDRFGNLNSAYRFDGNNGTERYIQANIGKHDTITFCGWFKSPYPITMYPDIINYGSANRLDITIAGNHPAYIANGSVGKIAAGAVVGGTWTPLIATNLYVTDSEAAFCSSLLCA